MPRRTTAENLCVRSAADQEETEGVAGGGALSHSQYLSVCSHVCVCVSRGFTGVCFIS